MSKLTWDATGTRYYETGVDHGVLYLIGDGGAYSTGVAWNGLTAVNENPTGAEANPLYADNIKYLNLMSAEEFECSVEAYTYPDEFAECDGSVEVIEGMYAGQQSRKTFGLSYRTKVGNDVVGQDLGYKLHLVYGCLASPSEKGYESINDDPDAINFSWDISTTPVELTGYKPTATLTFDSRKFSSEFMTQLETIIYGDENTNPRLPLPNEIVSLFKKTQQGDTQQGDTQQGDTQEGDTHEETNPNAQP